MSRQRSRHKRKNRRRKNFLTAVLMIALLGCMGLIIFIMQDILFQQKENEQAVQMAMDGQAEVSAEGELAEAAVSPTPEPTATPTPTPQPLYAGDILLQPGFEAVETEATFAPDEAMVGSTNSLLIDLSNDTIIAEKGAKERISPASMTKVLTILVAAEHIQNPDDLFTVTSEMTSYSLVNGCNAAGFVGGETVSVRDLCYGTILPSGGEAALALATYVAGSHEAFVELMNQKIEELGLSDTAHFTNCIGLYDENHYCTAYDMAMIMKAAIANDFAREVLSTKVYTTAMTEQNPEGLILSNWFLRRIEDKDCGGTVVAAKTGFVNESGNCAVSYFVSASGRPYLCVTLHAVSSWSCIYDHVAMYLNYTA